MARYVPPRPAVQATLSPNEVLMIYTGNQIAPVPYFGATGKRYIVSRTRPFAANEADVNYLELLGCFRRA